MTDAVRRYLEQVGARADLVAGGLRGLVQQWEQVAAEVARGYRLTLDDYRNDLDVRDLLAGALDAAGVDERETVIPRVEDADRIFVDATEPAASIWADERDPSVGRTRWWYRRRPKKMGAALKKDLNGRARP